MISIRPCAPTRAYVPDARPARSPGIYTHIRSRERVGDNPLVGEQEMGELSPAHILDVGMGFWPAKTLLSAVELGLFSELGNKSMAGEELQTRLGLHPR